MHLVVIKTEHEFKTAGIKISDKGILTLTKPVCMYFTSEKMKKINKKQIFSLKCLPITYNDRY